MKNKVTLFVLLFVVVGLVQLANAGGPPGICNGKLHSDNYGSNAGTFSNWAFRADGTTEGQWTMNTPDGTVVSDNASGTYTYSGGKAIAKCTGTATLSGVGTNSYSMTITLTFPESGSYASEGTYSINFKNWRDDRGTWQGNRYTAPIAEHVYFVEIWQDQYYEGTDDVEYEFELELETDDTINGVEFLTPNGQTFTIPYDDENWDDATGTWTESYHVDGDVWEWEFCRGQETSNHLQDFGDGWYTVTVYYKAGGQDQTRVWFGAPYDDGPLKQPTQKPVPTNPLHKEGNVSPSTSINWNSCKDKNVKSIWVDLGNEEKEYEVDSDLPKTATSWTPPEPLTDGYWRAEVSFDNYYYMETNADGIEVSNGKCTGVEYEFAVGEPWAVYEVYGGNSYPSQPDTWNFFYNIDQQQDYTRLGGSGGASSTFPGQYDYYVIVAREEFLLDSIQGSDSSYYPDGGLEQGNTSDSQNISGPPDNQSATVGYQESGGSFRGFVVISNPGNWTDLTVLVPSVIGTVSIQKCTVKAGKSKKGEPLRGVTGFIPRDSIRFSGTLNVTENDLNNAIGRQVRVTVDSDDMPGPYVATFNVPEGSIKKGSKYTSPKIKPVLKTDSKESFKVETKKGKFKFAPKNIDLTGLSCPLSFKVEIGNYVAQVDLDETIVNGKKPVPIQFMMGVKDTLRVDKAKVKKGKKFFTDSISVKGAFTVADTDPYDKNAPVVITLGSDTFTVPGRFFVTKRAVESCKKAPANEGGIVSAKFDSSKCTFTISIKKAALSDTGNEEIYVDFSIDLFGKRLPPPRQIPVPPDPPRPELPRPYTFWELTQYDQPGSAWTYDQKPINTVVRVSSSGSGYRIREDEGDAWADFYYHNENDEVHLKRFTVDGDFMSVGLEFNCDLLVWPGLLSPGQTHQSTSPFTGEMSAWIPGAGTIHIYLSGTAEYKITKVREPKQTKVPSGAYQAVQFDDSLTFDGLMTYSGQEVGTFKFVMTNKNYCKPDFGVVKRVRTGKVTAKIYGEGTIKESIKVTYLLLSP